MNTTVVESYVQDRPAPALWSRRNALRLAVAAVPAIAAITIPALGGVAEAAGYYKPTASNTGVPSGTRLTKRSGDIVVTKDGTVISNLDIYGRVLIRARNVVVRNCRIRGTNSPRSNTGLVDCNHKNVRNALIERCTLAPDKATVWLDGVIGKEYTAKWNNVYNVVDGFGVYNATDRKAATNVRIESNYIHDLSYFAKDPNHGNGPTHNDCIQVQGGSNVNIIGNNIQVFMSTSAGDQNYAARNIGQGILMQPNLAAITRSNISYNWIDGGKASMYFCIGNQRSMNIGTCSNNRFGKNQYRYGRTSQYQIRIQKGVTLSGLTSNVWDATGTAFKVASTGGIRYA